MAERIGEIFLKKKLVTEEQLEAALQEQTHTGEFLGEILVRLGHVDEQTLLNVLAEQFKTRFVSLEKVQVNPHILKFVPRDLVLEYKFLPIDMRSNVLLIAVSNPLDMWPMSMLQEKLNLADVQVVLATKKDILEGIKRFYEPTLGVS